MWALIACMVSISCPLVSLSVLIDQLLTLDMLTKVNQSESHWTPLPIRQQLALRPFSKLEAGHQDWLQSYDARANSPRTSPSAISVMLPGPARGQDEVEFGVEGDAMVTRSLEGGDQ